MKQILKANLVNAPQIKTDKNGKEYVTFDATENRYQKNEDGSFSVMKGKANFYRVCAYGPFAIAAAKELQARDFVRLEGEATKGDKVTFFHLKNAKLLKRFPAKEAA